MEHVRRLACTVRILTIMTITLLLSVPLSAQAAWNSAPTEHAVKGIINVTSSLIADSFVPMTHYSTGEWRINGVPAWFQVDRPFEDPDIEGNGLYGWAGALGGGYALNDRLLVYGVAAMLSMNGGIKGKLYGDTAGEVKADAEYALFSLCTGIGFDLMTNKGPLSVPVYAGVFVQRYDATVKLPEIGYTVPVIGNLQVDVEGDGMLFGATLGIAVSYDLFNFLRLTPYYLYCRSFNKPELKATISDSAFPLTPQETIEIDPVNASLVGLCITFISKKRLSVSLSVGGILSSSSGFYNDTFLDGLRMKSVVLALTYRSAP